MMWILSLLLILVSAPLAGAFPTSSNIIPTADMLEVGAIRAEGENDGYPGLLGKDSDSHLLLQYGMDARTEVGADLYSAGRANDLVLNLKWLAVSERDHRPALAAGLMDLNRNWSPTAYLVSSKEVGRGLRLHLGGAQCADSRALLLGAELKIGPKDYLLADAASWREGYRSLGIYHELSDGVGLNLAYAWPNQRDESGLVLLNVSRTFNWD